MIVEMRTYTLRPGTLAEAEKRFGEALPHREKHGKLAAFWHTEVGPLNQIIHVWAYDNFEHRTTVRGAAMKEEGWPPKIQEFITNMQSEIFHPAPFSPPLEPRQVGPLFEIRQVHADPWVDPRSHRALVREDRGAAEILAADRRHVFGVRLAQQVGAYLGLQGCQRAQFRARRGSGHRAMARAQSARRGGEAGELIRDAGCVLADPVGTCRE